MAARPRRHVDLAGHAGLHRHVDQDTRGPDPDAGLDPTAPSTVIPGLTKDSVITCQDCHAGLSLPGPHGASDNWAPDPNYSGDFSMAGLTKNVTMPSGACSPSGIIEH